MNEKEIFFVLISKTFHLYILYRKFKTSEILWKTLTILIPAYNEEKIIEESLTRLSVKFFKAIVINDSSNDKPRNSIKLSKQTVLV